jgi:hypothetical protein
MYCQEMEEIQQVQEGGGREEGLRTHLCDWPPTAAAQTGEGIKKGTAELTSVAAAANLSLNSTEDHSRSPVAAAEQVSAQIASQTLWESKVLESIMPSGFYSMVPVSFWITVHQHACLIQIHLCVCVCVCVCVSLDSSSLSLSLSLSKGHNDGFGDPE